MYAAFLKAGQSIRQKYNSIPSENRKRARNILLLVIIILLFRKKIIDPLRRMMHKDINKLEVNKSNLSYEKGQYFSMCSTLESAMNGTGTQEDSIMNVMVQLKTQDDWDYLQQCFGIRKKDGGTFYADLTGDLKMWLADDLDGGELDDVRQTLQLHNIIY